MKMYRLPCIGAIYNIANRSLRVHAAQAFIP